MHMCPKCNNFCSEHEVWTNGGCYSCVGNPSGDRRNALRSMTHEEIYMDPNSESNIQKRIEEQHEQRKNQ